MSALGDILNTSARAHREASASQIAPRGGAFPGEFPAGAKLFARNSLPANARNSFLLNMFQLK